MTIQEHINKLIDESKIDLGASHALAAAGYYGHSLFFAHLVLEKLCKSLWIKTHNSHRYPFIHNLIKILSETGLTLSNKQMQFYAEMNYYQANGRYPETLEAIEKIVTKELFTKYYLQIHEEIIWLTKLLQ